MNIRRAINLNLKGFIKAKVKESEREADFRRISYPMLATAEQ